MAEKIICANPYGLPLGGSYESVSKGMIYHPKYATNQEEGGQPDKNGDLWGDGLCYLCRDIQAHENDDCEPEVDETDQSAEDEALAYERMSGEYTGVQY